MFFKYNSYSLEESWSFILNRRPDNLGESVRSVDTVCVRAVSPQQRIIAGGEHQRQHGVAGGQGAGGIVEHQHADVSLVQVGDHLLQVVVYPVHLHQESMIINVFDNSLARPD